MVSRCWIILLVLLLWAGLGWAQSSLTPEQAAIYRNDVVNVHAAEFAQALADPNNIDFKFITDSYNKLQSPDFYVWKSALTRREIYESKVVDAPPSQTAWSWQTYKGQSIQERESWVEMLHDGVINPSLDNTRANYNVIFGGQGASLNQQNFLLALSRRKALRIEVLFVVTGSGAGTAATPSVLGREGTVSITDTLYAIGGP